MDKRQDLVEHICKITGALQEGHFRLRSGRHGLHFLDCWEIFSYPNRAEDICRVMAEGVSERLQGDLYPEIIMGPERGAIWMAQGVARNLVAQHPDIRALFAEKDPSIDDRYPFVIPKQWLSVIKGKRVVVVEDVYTTGGSTRKVVDIIRQAGGEVLCVAVLWNRGGFTQKDYASVPMSFSLMARELPSFTPDECPVCKEGLDFDN